MSNRAAATTVVLVPIHLGSQERRLTETKRRLERDLYADVRLMPPPFDPEEAFDQGRGQYNSTSLLRRLLDAELQYGDRVLGVAGVDLFIPVLTYVFGEAQLDGRAAVVSTWRLDPTLYGLPESEPLVLDRLEKEALHELGHTWGLVHCPSLACVMRSSTWVEEIDLKPARFCVRCQGRLPR